MGVSQKWMRLWGAGVVAVAVLALAPTIARAAEKVRFEMDWVIGGKLAPFFVGLAKGYYKEEGLDVTISRGFGSARGVQDLTNKTVEYAFVDSIAAIVGRSRGAPLKYVSLIYAEPPHIIVSLEKTGIRTPQDLKGKTLGGPVEDTGRYIVAALLSANGMRPEDVKWVTTTPAAKSPSLLSGQIDAFPFFNTSLPPLIAHAKKNNMKLSILTAAKWGVDIYSNGILTLESRIQENRKQVQGLVRAAMRSWARSIENPGETVEILRNYVAEVNPVFVRDELERTIEIVLTDHTKKEGIGMIDEAKMQRTIDFVTQYLKLARKVSTREMYTNEFLPKLIPKRGS